jgi:hypothetical protein
MTPIESDKPLPLRSVLTRPIVISIANYAMLALLCAIVESYTPLVWSTPIKYGGLSLSPASIGLWLSMYGGMNGIFQLFFFPRFVGRFGSRLVFVFSIISCALNYILFPFENLAAVAGGGPNHIIVCLLIVLQMSCLCFFDMGYGTFLLRLLRWFTQKLIHARRCDVYVHFVCCSQQAVAWRRVWSCAGGVLGPERPRTGSGRTAICVLVDS